MAARADTSRRKREGKKGEENGGNQEGNQTNAIKTAKLGGLTHLQLSFGVEENVLGFDVAMRNTLTVQVLYAHQHLAEDTKP